MSEITGNIHKIESFGLVDGPGVRTVIFLKGCAMRCRYCHNPDTWSGTGDRRTATGVFSQVRRFRPYWKNNGGITVSGGEPLLQLPFVTELFSLAKKEGIDTAVDTAGQPFNNSPEWLKAFEKLASMTDLFILDLKLMDRELHRQLTGVTNENILEMAMWLSAHDKKMWIRHVLVPGLTDDENDLKEISDFIRSLKTVERVEILPYHSLGIPKWKELGLEYTLEDVCAPTQEQIRRAQDILGCK